MANILLFGGGLQMLSVARSLKEENHKVIATTKNDCIAMKSRFIDLHVNMENDTEAERVAAHLIGLIRELKIDVVIPMEDAQATSLSRCKNIIERDTNAKCAVMDWIVFQLASDKTKLLDYCRQHNIPHPKTSLIEEDYHAVSEYVGFPALIKPSHSEGAKGIVMVGSEEELKAKAPIVKKEYGECALQEFIGNKDYYYNLMLFRGNDGSWGNHVILKILRYYPVKGGSSSMCVTVENDKMVEMCKHLLELLAWKGFADFDILEKGDGDYRIIEINPRVPASVRGAAISGVNYPCMMVSDLLYGKFKNDIYEPGKYLRYLGLDIAWFLASPNRWRCKPSWFNFFNSNVYYQEGGVKDFPAMWTSMVEGVKKQLNPEFRKKKSGMN